MVGSARNVTRQREAGAAARAETRRRLLEAASQEFLAGGYAKATVARIAARAGVTVQTLYLAWGSKRALLRAYLEAALSGEPGTPYAEQLPRIFAAALDPTERDPRVVLEQVARLFRATAERAGTGWQLYRDAAASDPAVADDWRALQELRLDTFTSLIGRLPRAALRPGLTAADAAHTFWAIASPETFDLLVRVAGYTLDAYEEWVATTLAAALLRPPPEPRGARDGSP